jgi:hypothetical protein
MNANKNCKKKYNSGRRQNGRLQQLIQDLTHRHADAMKEAQSRHEQERTGTKGLGSRTTGHATNFEANATGASTAN